VIRKILLFLFLLEAILFAGVFSAEIRPDGQKSDRVGQIRILDQRELIFDRVGGKAFSEISDLAYLAKRHWLFMLSDEGKLFRFRARFGNKIEELTPLDANTLRKKSGKKLKKWRRDSEGMTLDGKDRLYVSFEEKPRIARISYGGRILRTLKLPRSIDSMKKMLRKNKGLEALIWHPRYGLVTAPEQPVKGANRQMIQTLYALSGKRWSYRRGGEEESSITALEVLPNGDFLILERAYAGLLSPVVVTLRELQVQKCRHEGLCPTRVLARFDSSKGWAVENFEGLVRVADNRYVMVSDDNDNFFQRTILLYFEVEGK